MRKKLYLLTLKDFLKEISFKKPSPGGGSVSAFCSCMGVSLVEKILKYSSIDKVYLSSFNKAKKDLLLLLDKDAYYFEKKDYENACMVSDKIFDISFKMVKKIERLKPSLKKIFLPDIILSYSLLYTSCRNCLENIKVNIKLLKDKGSKNRWMKKKNILEKKLKLLDKRWLVS